MELATLKVIKEINVNSSCVENLKKYHPDYFDENGYMYWNKFESCGLYDRRDEQIKLLKDRIKELEWDMSRVKELLGE